MKLLELLKSKGISPYPARCVRSCSISELKDDWQRQPDKPELNQYVTGRIHAIDAGSVTLEDYSGRIRVSVAAEAGVEPPIEAEAEPTLESDGFPDSLERAPSGPLAPVPFTPQQIWPLLKAGDIVQIELTRAKETDASTNSGRNDAALVVRSVAILAPMLESRSMQVGSSDPLEWPNGAVDAAANGAPEALIHSTGISQPSHPSPERPERASLSALAARAAIMRQTRDFFVSQGFLEVETPILATTPGLEPQLDPFVSSYRGHPGHSGCPVYLLTSPEYAMKRLLVDGLERIFQLSKVFRNGELGPFHNPEFTMLEWYRAYASYLEIMEDLEAWIPALVKPDRGDRLRWQGHEIDLTPPWERLTVREAFIRYAELDLAEATELETLRAAATRLEIRCSHKAGWEEIFFQILLERVEAKLGFEKPTFLTDYPARFAALAKVRDEDFPVAERFELYIAGIELANAYSELNDPEAQAARFREEQEERRGLGLPVFKPDLDYLAALRRGLPPTGGIAVGMDRLIMLLLDAPNIQRGMAFPFTL